MTYIQQISNGTQLDNHAIYQKKDNHFYMSSRRLLGKNWIERAGTNIDAINRSKQLEQMNISANEKDRILLSKYVGFGATEIANGIFPNPKSGQVKSGWEYQSRRLKDATNEKEYASLRRSTQYAHYTPEFIVENIWKGLARLGFKGGRALEPGFGSGLFLALLPEEFQDNTSFTGIENEPVTARISRLLYPQAQIIESDFQNIPVAEEYDLVVGNPPYSLTSVASDPHYAKIKPKLHDYFILKSIDFLKPYGLAAFVTSQGTLNKSDQKIRQAISQSCNLLAAIRLPEGTFNETAGTQVGVDILFFQKRGEQSPPKSESEWLQTLYIKPDDPSLPVYPLNEYFINNPQMVLGENGIRRGIYGPEPTYCCKPISDKNIESLLDQAIRQIRPVIGAVPQTIIDLEDIKQAGNDNLVNNPAIEGSYDLIDGLLVQWENRRPVPVKVKDKKGSDGIFPKHAEIIQDLIPIKKTIRLVIEKQQNGEDSTETQNELNRKYDQFVIKHGPLNLRKIYERKGQDGEITEYYKYINLSPFMSDPDVWLISSIENYDEENDTYSKGPIFKDIILSAYKPPQISSASDALANSLNELGKVDIGFMAKKLNIKNSEIIQQLGESIYKNPHTGNWETRDEYLSGPVKEKLNLAIKASHNDREYNRNIEALEKVQPKPIPPSEITARLGSPWIPCEAIEQFISEIIETSANVAHSPAAALWTVTGKKYSDFNTTTNARWGTKRRTSLDIINDALNQTSPKIYDTIEDGGAKTRILNVQETDAVKDRINEIRLKFEEWIWKDPQRALELSIIYNDKHNNLVPREYDGSHLTLSHANKSFKFYSKQKRAIWRIIAEGCTYIAHAVGAGKTATIIAATVEQKRLGLISKPMIVVPAHCLISFAKTFLFLYPNSKILVADEYNFAMNRRRQFLSRAATGNWDAIIITHSAFKLIPTPAEFERIYLEDMAADYANLIADQDDRTTIKKLERLKEQYQNKLELLKSRKDDFLNLADIGIDQITIDEAQEFRKLSFVTNMTDLKGVDPNGSQMAWDLYIKSKYIESRNPHRIKNRSLNLASGTPITNTIGEMFSAIRFINEDLLKNNNTHRFDAWAAIFGTTRTELELQPSGHYKPVTRFAQFINIPELFTIFRQCADIVLPEELRQYVKVPEIRTGKRQVITSPATSEFRAYQKHLAERIKLIEERSGAPKKGDDIILSVINDGRLAAIDLRLAGINSNHHESKLNQVVNKVYQTYKQSENNAYHTDGVIDPIKGSLQTIYSDIGINPTKKSGDFTVYDYVKTQLIQLGIPESEIYIIHHAKRTSDKDRIFEAAKKGVIKIILGSSDKLGTGSNIQKRLIAQHHIDVPYLPSKIEQRDGRIIRQGNQNEIVDIFIYATLGSTDATMWQTNERKARFINAALTGDKTVRIIEDLDDQANQFAIAKAISSGDPRLMQKAGLESEIQRLKRLEGNHYDQMATIKYTVMRYQKNIEERKIEIERIKNDIIIRNNNAELNIDKASFGENLINNIKSSIKSRRTGVIKIGELHGFKILMDASYDSITSSYSYEVKVDRNGINRVISISSRTSRDIAYQEVIEIINGYEKEVQRHSDHIQRLSADSEKLLKEINLEFPYRDDLLNKIELLNELEDDLQSKPNNDDQQDAVNMDALCL